jgi:pimeloyl-ACP methyl ester carboxylesterase
MQLAGKVIRQGGMLIALVGLSFGTASAALAVDWPQWRENELHSASPDQAVNLPLASGWSLEGYHFFSPAMANGVIYLPRSTDPGTPTPGGGLVAYRLTSGEQLWTRTDLPVWGNAAVSGEAVIIGGSALYALNSTDGSTRWSYDEPAASDIIFENPTVVGDTVYAWKRHTGITAFDLITGARRWTTILGSVSGSAPIVTTEAVYAIGNYPSSPRGTVWKLDSATGAVIWRTPLLYFVNGGLLSGDTIVAAGPVRTFGLDMTTGTIRWWRNLAGAGMPVATGSTVSVLYERQMSLTTFLAYMISFDAASGPSNLDYGVELGGRARGVSPVLAGEQFIYSTEDGTIHVRQGVSKVGAFEGLDPWAPEFAAADGKLLAWNFLGQRFYTFGTGAGGDGVAEEKEPVVFVPGIATSWNGSVMSNPPDINYTPQDGWRFLPLIRLAYQALFNGFEQIGLRQDEGYFIAYYDWRLPMADAGQYYLEEAIDKARRVSGKSKVDIVAHSYGGLVARAYIQGSGYRDDVDQLIVIGTPNAGSAKAYATWQGGKVPAELPWQLLNIYLWKQSVKELISKFDYIRLYIRAIKDLLPTVDYVIDLSTGTHVSFLSMIEKNLNLLVYNQNTDDLFRRSRTTIGAGKKDTEDITKGTIENVQVPYHGYGMDGARWPDGKLDPENPYVKTLDGDGTVLISSAILDGANQFPLRRGSHAWLINIFANDILAELGYQTTVNEIPAPTKTLYFSFASPLTVLITDPGGSVVNTASGEVTIPNAEYIQEDNLKIIGIPNPIAGGYQIELSGRGGGEYHGFISMADDTSQAMSELEIIPGFITEGQTITYGAEIPVEVTDPVSFEPLDQVPPITSHLLNGISGNNGWYRSPVFITLSATDETGVWKIEYRIVGEDWQLHSGPFTVNNQGTMTVEYRSIDQVGNVEEVKSVEIKIDTAPPTVVFEPAINAKYLHNQVIESSVKADDAISGIASTSLSLDGQAASFPIDLFYSRLGDHELAGQATDHAGNSSEIRQTFHVGATIDSTLSDLNRIHSLGWITRWSTYFKLRIRFELADRFEDMIFLPVHVRQRLVRRQVERSMKMLQRESDYLTARAYGILYDNGKYLLDNL